MKPSTFKPLPAAPAKPRPLDYPSCAKKSPAVAWHGMCWVALMPVLDVTLHLPCSHDTVMHRNSSSCEQEMNAQLLNAWHTSVLSVPFPNITHSIFKS